MSTFIKWLRYNFLRKPYDSNGNLHFLNAREHKSPNEIAPSFPEDAVKTTLLLICECFDIEENQIGQMRFTDKLWDLYTAVRQSSWTDDMELERLVLELENRSINVDLADDFFQTATIEDYYHLLYSE